MPKHHQPEADERCRDTSGRGALSTSLELRYIAADTHISALSKLVEDCETRLAEDEVADLLRLVAEMV